MRIPNRFKLFGQTIEVKYGDTLLSDEECYGLAMYRKNQIVLQSNSPSTPLKSEQIEHSFFHELVHHILYYAGGSVQLKDDLCLRKQEDFVNLVAGLLHQALTTMEYDPEDKTE